MVGLYAAFIIATTTSIVGGRPAMISGAAGAVALIVTPLVRDHGVEYLFAATILMGIIQLILGILKIGRLMKFIPRSVMIGFVNALAILIFMSQLEHIFGISISTYMYLIIFINRIYCSKILQNYSSTFNCNHHLNSLYVYRSKCKNSRRFRFYNESFSSFSYTDVPFNVRNF